MATINQLRQERQAYFRELKRVLKPVDTAVEKLQRFNQRILDRKRDIPEVSDYEQAMQELESLLQTLVAVQKLLDTGRAIFSVL